MKSLLQATSKTNGKLGKSIAQTVTSFFPNPTRVGNAASFENLLSCETRGNHAASWLSTSTLSANGRSFTIIPPIRRLAEFAGMHVVTDPIARKLH